MRLIVMTVVAMAWLTMPALAQIPGQAPGMTLPKMDKPAIEEEHRTAKPDEKAYKSALDGIQAKKSYDPWAAVREKPQSNGSR